MICLGIESTAHTFGVGIVKDNEVIADVKDMYIPPKGSGIIPRDAAMHHMEKSTSIIKECLEKADIKMKDIDAVAFSQGPGLPQCLRVGGVVARTLALKHKKPLIGVNHCLAHIEVGKICTSSKDPVVLYLSGGNTQVIAFAEGKYRVFGETQDVPIGNALDMVARSFGLSMPGGIHIEKLAKEGKYIELPYVVKGMDLSFSGLATEAIRQYEKGASKEDVSYSLQETCFAMLTEVAERAMAHTEKKELLLVGGVAANKRLQEMLKIMCEERGAKFFVVPMKYSGDNGSMIAVTGAIHNKPTEIIDSDVRQRWRVDDVEIE